MAKRKLTVTVGGQTFTRTTDRIYSHIVVSKPNQARDIENTLERCKWDAKTNFKYYTREAGDNPQFKHSAAALENNKRIASLGADGYLSELIEKAMQHISSNAAKGYYEKPTADGWCGRLDLAQKVAADSAKHLRLDIQIAPLPQ